MVLARRRSTTYSTPSYKTCRPRSPVPLTCPSEVKMGDGRHSPTEWTNHFSSSSDSSFHLPNKLGFSFDQVPETKISWEEPSASKTLRSRLVPICIFIFCLYGGSNLHSSRKVAIAMENEMKAMTASLERSQESRDEIQRIQLEAKTKRNEVYQQHEILAHEVKMIETMEAEGVSMRAPNGQANVQSWMNRRKEGLEHHLRTLRLFLQQQSKQAVLERFGESPHLVEATVEIKLEGEEKASLKKFVIEMASVDDVPHAVFFFLETVDKGLWDDTVLLHHEQVDHVIAAVPLDFESQNIKHDRLQELELQTMAFPEYSPNHPHKKYTLGFADLGPTFYINTDDNTEPHGPGGQEHHRSPEDADPCFARVVTGFDVVDALVHHGSKASNLFSPDGSHPWRDTGHTWTRIVSLQILSHFKKRGSSQAT